MYTEEKNHDNMMIFIKIEIIANPAVSNRSDGESSLELFNESMKTVTCSKYFRTRCVQLPLALYISQITVSFFSIISIFFKENLWRFSLLNRDLWKYCSKEQINEYILSFELLGNTKLTDKQQLSCLYNVSNHPEKHYQQHRIYKKDGTLRRISEPDPLLKVIQTNILKNILTQRTPSIYATAYQKGKRLVDNTDPHVNQKQILKLDIKNFFGCISYSMIAHNAFPGIYYPPAVVGLLTNLCCFCESLPQGAPTSPVISNLVMKSFDNYMGQWCLDRHINYTRFCDDMTFSGEFDDKMLYDKVRSFLREMGFTLNDKKTRLISKDYQQLVTGIVVNEKMQVSRSYRKKLRQELYYCIKYGVKSHLIYQKNEKYLEMGDEGREAYLNHLMGRTNYILQINPLDQEFLIARKCLTEMISRNKGVSKSG